MMCASINKIVIKSLENMYPNCKCLPFSLRVSITYLLPFEPFFVVLRSSCSVPLSKFSSAFPCTTSVLTRERIQCLVADGVVGTLVWTAVCRGRIRWQLYSIPERVAV